MASNLSGARWLLRPGISERLGGALVGLMLLGAWSLFTIGDEPLAALVLLPAGLVLSAPRRRGVAIREPFVEMNTLLSCTRIPLTEITRLHTAPYMSVICVETRQSAYRFADGSRIPDGTRVEFLAETKRLGKELDVEVVEHENIKEFVEATRRSRLPGWDARGFASTFRWPEVYLTIGIGATLTLLN